MNLAYIISNKSPPSIGSAAAAAASSAAAAASHSSSFGLMKNDNLVGSNSSILNLHDVPIGLT